MDAGEAPIDVCFQCDYDELWARFQAGERVGGAFLICRPAQTAAGQQRERTCLHSEATSYGEEWFDKPRCLKQIIHSCDRCFGVIDRPFYVSILARFNGGREGGARVILD